MTLSGETRLPKIIRTSKKKMKNPVTRQHSQSRLQQVIDFCRANRGALMAIKRAFDATTRIQTARETFQAWLDPDPATRTEPLYGSALVLEAAARQVMREWPKKALQQPAKRNK